MFPECLLALDRRIHPRARLCTGNSLYTGSATAGLEHLEDLASPALAASISIAAATRCRLVAADTPETRTLLAGSDPEARWRGGLAAPGGAARAGFPGRLERAADAYVVRRGAGRTIVAGYPWFTDWGRDTFIALRGPLPGHW